MRFLVRLLVNAAALWVATRLVPGVWYSAYQSAQVVRPISCQVVPCLSMAYITRTK